MQAAESSAAAIQRPPTAPPPAARPEVAEELTRLAAELETRKSVVHLARGAVLMFIAFISGGLTLRLFLDSTGLPIYWWAAMAVFAGALVIGLGQLVRGRALVASERARFERYLELRSQAGLDDAVGR